MEQGDGTVIASGGLGMLMRGEPVPVSEWTRLGEFGAWSLITAWSEHRDPVLSMLARGLLERRLFRSVDRDLSSSGAEEEDDAQVARIVDSLSPAERFLFVVDEARDLPYRPYAPRDGHARHSVRILGRDGRVYPIEERSPMVRALGDAGYRFRRWCYHPDLRSRIRSVSDASL
jgi:HD superfamily phosphohydrolase